MVICPRLSKAKDCTNANRCQRLSAKGASWDCQWITGVLAAQVYANDLNPRSTHYLAVNVRLNRLGDGVRVFNMDGRAFLRLLCDTPSGPAADIRRQKQQQGQQPAEEPKQQQEPEPVSAGIAVPQAAAGAAAAAAAGTTAAAEGAAASPAVGQPAKRQRTKERVFEAQGPVPPVPESFTPPVGGIMFDHVVGM